MRRGLDQNFKCAATGTFEANIIKQTELLASVQIHLNSLDPARRHLFILSVQASVVGARGDGRRQAHSTALSVESGLLYANKMATGIRIFLFPVDVLDQRYGHLPTRQESISSSISTTSTADIMPLSGDRFT